MAFLDKFKKQIEECKPIKYADLIFYPLKVKQYEEWQENSQCIMQMQQSFPIELASMPYLRMLIMFDIATQKEFFIPKIKKLFSMCCKISIDNINIMKYNNADEIEIHLTIKEKKIKKELKKTILNIMEMPIDRRFNNRIVFFDETENEYYQLENFESEIDIERQIIISEVQFIQIRKILTAQQKTELPKEESSKEIVDINIANDKNQLEYSLQSKIYTIALFRNVSANKVRKMKIYDFEMWYETITRTKAHEMYGIGELSGMVTFKKGNPYPSLFFNRKIDDFEKYGLELANDTNKQFGLNKKL